MSEVFPKDVLLRVSPKMLERYQSLCVAGAGRGRATPLPFTFSRADASTCASYIDRDGLVRVAAANKLRTQWEDLDGDGIRETPGILFEGERTNIIPWSDAISNWTSSLTPVVTDAFATLGDLSLALIEDDNAAGREEKLINFSFTGDGVKGVQFFVRAPATPTDANDSRLTVFDTVAGGGTNRLVVSFTWNADGTLASATALTGTILGTPKKLGNAGGLPVYLVTCQATAVTAANLHQFYLTPCNTAGNLGKMVIGGIQCENGTFPSSRIKTAGAALTRASDALTVPFNFGPMDMAVLGRMGRPIYADLSTDPLGTQAAGLVTIGSGSTPRLELGISSDATPLLFGGIRQITPPDKFSTMSNPAGAEVKFCARYRNFGTGAQVQVETTAGNAAESTAGAIIPAFGNQTLVVGKRVAESELFGNLFDLMFLRGLPTLNEALAVP